MSIIATIYTVLAYYNDSSKTPTQGIPINNSNLSGKFADQPHFYISKIVNPSPSVQKILVKNDGGKVFDLEADAILQMTTSYKNIRIDEFNDFTVVKRKVEGCCSAKVDQDKKEVTVNCGCVDELIKLRKEIHKSIENDIERLLIIPAIDISLQCKNEAAIDKVYRFSCSIGPDNSDVFCEEDSERKRVEDFYSLRVDDMTLFELLRPYKRTYNPNTGTLNHF